MACVVSREVVKDAGQGKGGDAAVCGSSFCSGTLVPALIAHDKLTARWERNWEAPWQNSGSHSQGFTKVAAYDMRET